MIVCFLVFLFLYLFLYLFLIPGRKSHGRPNAVLDRIHKIYRIHPKDPLRGHSQ